MGMVMVVAPICMLLYYPCLAIDALNDVIRSLGAPGLQELGNALHDLFSFLNL
ncbi:MAG: hypothetical protein IK080_04215 [Clostridia bacterium]|nr:hypothetical protein [Clostridia bacterium]